MHQIIFLHPDFMLPKPLRLVGGLVGPVKDLLPWTSTSAHLTGGEPEVVGGLVGPVKDLLPRTSTYTHLTGGEPEVVGGLVGAVGEDLRGR